MSAPSKAQRLKNLKSIPIFAGLSDAALDRIRKVSAELEVPHGQVLVQRGSPASGLFIVEEGAVVVEARGKMIELGPGECFGELALLTDKNRTARVRAKSDVRCLVLNRFEFRKLLLGEPKMAVAMLEMLAERFVEAT